MPPGIAPPRLFVGTQGKSPDSRRGVVPSSASEWASPLELIEKLAALVVGAKRPSEVEDNMGALGWELTDDVRAEIDRIFANYEIDVAPNKWVEKAPDKIDPNRWVPWT